MELIKKYSIRIKKYLDSSRQYEQKTCVACAFVVVMALIALSVT